MGRAAQHTTDDFLDAAVELFAHGGARAVTMAAVARSTAAPSGSVYHRFEGRGSLLAALWLRTSSGFEAEYKAALGSSPTPEAAAGAAVWMVEWCRSHRGLARVLNAGPGALEPRTWPEAMLATHRSARKALVRDIAALTESVAEGAGVPHDEAAFAMFGLPMAVVGDHLRDGDRVPPGAVDLVRRLASRLLLLDTQPA